VTLPLSPISIEPAVSSRAPDTSGPESVRKDTRLLLVSNDAMRARRRPRAVLWLYVYQLAVAFLVAWPISRALGAAFAGHPRGSAVLFDDGGWALLALRHAYEHASPGFMALLACAVVGGAAAGIVPLASLLVSISHATPQLGAPRARHLAPYVVVAFQPMAILLVLSSLLEIALLLVAFRVSSSVSDALSPSSGDARGDLFGVAAGLLVAALAMLVGVLHDLARAALARFRVGVRGAVRHALLTLRRAPFRLVWSWAWRGIAGWLAVAVVATFAARLGASTMTLVVLVLLHQAAAVARVMFRASWLARALRAVDRAR
jgi:hypothetical protein